MADHTVTLTYTQTTFKADPDPVAVASGDTISFQLVAAPNATFKVTMKEPDIFSPVVIDHPGAKITVVKTLPSATTYQCQLFDATGKSLFQSSATQPGGGVRPGGK